MSKLIQELKDLNEIKGLCMENIRQLEVMKPKFTHYHGDHEGMGIHGHKNYAGMFKSYKTTDKAGNNYEVYINIFPDEWKDFKEYLLSSNYHRLNEVNIRINEIESIDIKPRTKKPTGTFINWFKKRIS